MAMGFIIKGYVFSLYLNLLTVDKPSTYTDITSSYENWIKVGFALCATKVPAITTKKLDFGLIFLLFYRNPCKLG